MRIVILQLVLFSLVFQQGTLTVWRHSIKGTSINSKIVACEEG
jgi:hypothetical protein